MSDSTGASNFEPLLRPMMDYWAAYTKQWVKATSGGDAQQAQREWLDSASETVDEYLRSPLFLELLKQHIDTLIEMQQRAKDASRPSASVELGEVQEQLKRIVERLAVIEGRLPDQGAPP